MTASKNHIRQKAFRFKRWSNKSYALFNAVGRIVHIGCLTTIIHKLITVKTMGFQGYLSSLEALGDSEEEEEENALLFHESVEMGGLVSVLPTPSCAGKCENSGLDISVLDHYKNYTKAFSGPFFIAENSYSKSRGMDFYAFFKPFI